MNDLKRKFIDFKNLYQNNYKKLFKIFIVGISTLLVGGTIGFSLNFNGNEIINTEFGLQLSNNHHPILVQHENGEVYEIDGATVEEVDSGKISECPENEECGLGEFVYIDVSSPEKIIETTIGKCVNVDNYAGSQCYDLSAAVSENMTGRRLTTCGTGAAAGMMNCKAENAGDDYIIIDDPKALQPGDILVLKGGQYGHTGIVVGSYNDGFIALLGTNQGGEKCEGGGSSANIVNINLKNFLGAYRWNKYVVEKPVEKAEDPVENLPISGCIEWAVKRGDTMSKIMVECEGFLEYGEVMDNYAKSWYSRLIKPGQSVYDGWNSKSGVGLYADDIIDHRL